MEHKECSQHLVDSVPRGGRSSGVKMMDHQAAAAGSLCKALNPHLLSCIDEINVSRSGYGNVNVIKNQSRSESKARFFLSFTDLSLLGSWRQNTRSLLYVLFVY